MKQESCISFAKPDLIRASLERASATAIVEVKQANQSNIRQIHFQSQSPSA